MTPASSEVNILLADDHPMFREAVRNLLEQEPGFRVVGEVGDGGEVMEQVHRLKPDLLLLDLLMPRVSGMDVLSTLQRSGVETRIIMLAADITRTQVVKALKLGIILKDSATELLFKSIRAVMSGEYWVSHENIADLVGYLNAAPQTTGSADGGNPYKLTPRELQITAAIVEGQTNKDIAKEFALSEQTVKHHLTRIFEKVGVTNRLELALFAIQHKLISS